MAPPKGSKTTQGYELQIGTNVLGPFLFTKLLLPILAKTAANSPKGTVRVSWASSFATYLSPKGGIQFSEDGTPLNLGGNNEAYAISKTANWFLAHEMGKRYGNKVGVLHNAFNPGNLRSGLQRYSKTSFGIISAFAWKILDLLILYPTIYGAYTELYSGLSPDFDFENDQGSFVLPWGRIMTDDVRKDVWENCKGNGDGSEKLWFWCERETHQYLI